jgi:D-methionine transport system ATP-binding protein
MEEGAVVEEGDVYNVFAAPRQPITQRFINSASPLSKIDKMIAEGSSLLSVKPGAKLVKLLFHKDSVGDSVISDVSRRFGVNLNIVLANVEVLKGEQLGSMIAVITGDDKNVNDATAYLKKKGVRTEVIEYGRAS